MAENSEVAGARARNCNAVDRWNHFEVGSQRSGELLTEECVRAIDSADKMCLRRSSESLLPVSWNVLEAHIQHS